MDKNKSVADFMNSFLNTPEPKIDNEYYEIEEQYFRQFGHGVPREMLPDSISTEQIKQAMKKCILSKEGKNAYENWNFLYFIDKRTGSRKKDPAAFTVYDWYMQYIYTYFKGRTVSPGGFCKPQRGGVLPPRFFPSKSSRI